MPTEQTPCTLSTLASFTSFFPWRLCILPCLLWPVHAVSHMWLLHCKKCCLCGSVSNVPAAHVSQGPTSLCLSCHSKSRPSPPMTAAWGEKRQGLWMIIYLLGCRHTFLWTAAVSPHSSMGRAFPPLLTRAQKAAAICQGHKEPSLPSVYCHLYLISLHTYQRLLVRTWIGVNLLFLTYHLQLCEGRVRCPLMNMADKVQ